MADALYRDPAYRATTNSPLDAAPYGVRASA